MRLHSIAVSNSRVKLGRVGGSRRGWVLQIGFPCHKTRPSPLTRHTTLFLPRRRERETERGGGEREGSGTEFYVTGTELLFCNLGWVRAGGTLHIQRTRATKEIPSPQHTREGKEDKEKETDPTGAREQLGRGKSPTRAPLRRGQPCRPTTSVSPRPT